MSTFKVIPVHYGNDVSAYRVVEVKPCGQLVTMTIQSKHAKAKAVLVARVLSRVQSTL